MVDGEMKINTSADFGMKSSEDIFWGEASILKW